MPGQNWGLVVLWVYDEYVRFVSPKKTGFPVNIRGMVAELFVHTLVRASARAYSFLFAESPIGLDTEEASSVLAK